MPTVENIEIYRGEEIELNFTMSPVEDISGWDIEFNIGGVKHAKLVTVLADINDGPNGTFTVTLTAIDTDIRPGRYSYDVWRTDLDTERVIAVGVFTVLDEVRVPV